MNRVKWGLLGCGWVARDYVAPAILGAKNAELVALCDRDENAMAQIEARGAARFTDVSAFLKSDFDAVYIATPNHLHAPLTIQAAGANKHVLCEKPMALTLPEAKNMAMAVAHNGVVYATAFDQRFHDAHQKLRVLIQRGELGKITAIRIVYACWTPPDWVPPTQSSHENWRVDPKKAGGGAFMDLAPHGLDLVQMLLGEDLKEIRCFFQNRVFDYGVDDGAMLIGRFGSGVLLTHHVSYNCPDTFPRRRLEVVGTQKMAILENTLGQTAGGSFQIVDAPTGARKTVELDTVSPFERSVETFSQSLLNREPFPFSIERDLNTMALLEEATRQNATL